MSFKKGASGNPTGRPPGSKNKKAEKIREWLVYIIDSNTAQLEADLRRLSPKERWRVISSILPYAIPKQTETRLNGSVDLNMLTDEQLEEIINTITANIEIDE